MQITINTDDFSTRDLDILTALVGVLNGDFNQPKQAAATGQQVAKAAAETPAKKAAEPESEPSGDTLDDAVRLVTKLVAAGKAQDVKDALADFGVGRVSQLAPGDVADFIAKLS